MPIDCFLHLFCAVISLEVLDKAPITMTMSFFGNVIFFFLAIFNEAKKEKEREKVHKVFRR